jgi:hypothetical protein
LGAREGAPMLSIRKVMNGQTHPEKKLTTQKIPSLNDVYAS